MVYQNHKNRSFRVCQDDPQGSVLGLVLFSFFINDLPASLPSSVSCSLYGNDLTIWFFSPSVSTAVEATQGALFRLERWSEYWCLPLSPSKCEASFSVNLHQANLRPISSYSTPASVNFSWGHLRPHSLLFQTCIFAEGQVFPCLKALGLISASLWGPSKESFSLL